jgi:hypothetical protein
MGGTPSTNVPVTVVAQKLVSLDEMEKEIIEFVKPIYYTDVPITEEEMNAAVNVWKLILNNRSEAFFKIKKEDPTIEFETCMDFFFHTIYTRLFDIHPDCRGLFHRSINKQGSFLLRFISMCIADWNDQQKWDKTLIQLANIHNKLGVKAVECTSSFSFY